MNESSLPYLSDEYGFTRSRPKSRSIRVNASVIELILGQDRDWSLYQDARGGRLNREALAKHITILPSFTRRPHLDSAVEVWLLAWLGRCVDYEDD